MTKYRKNDAGRKILSEQWLRNTGPDTYWDVGTQGISAWDAPEGSAQYFTLHNIGDKQHENKTYLDRSRDWKTKWVPTGGGHGGFWDNYDWANNPLTNEWGTSWNLEGGDSPQNLEIYANVLDWDAYNRDPRYQQFAKELGFDQGYTTLDQIMQAENAMNDPAWSERAANEAARLELETAQYKQQLKDLAYKQNMPQQIDIGGVEVPIAGINDYVSGLRQQWDNRYNQQQQQFQQQWDTRFSQLQNQLSQQQQGYNTSLDNLTKNFNVRSQRELDDLRYQLGSQFDTRIDDQRRAYDSRISDLTSQWDRSMGQFASNQKAYDQNISGLNEQIADFRERERMMNEQRINDRQRARVSASYGTWGMPNNPRVGGVATVNELQPWRFRGGGSRSAFNRGGMRISNLNLA